MLECGKSRKMVLVWEREVEVEEEVLRLLPLQYRILILFLSLHLQLLKNPDLLPHPTFPSAT